MIKINYTIERDEGNEVIEFKPNLIPTELPNIAYIQGPNSSGKSTLLNIIALAFFGDKLSKDQLSPDLRERIDSLLNSSHQKIEFNIEVENELIGTKLVSNKEDRNNRDIVVREISEKSNKPISAAAFKNKYRLIYDIPNNPLQRLPLLLNELKNNQSNLKEDITRLRNKIRQIIEEIKDSKDPELIDNLGKENIKNNTNLIDQQKILLEKINSAKDLRKYKYSRFYKNYLIEEENLQERIKEIKKELKNEKRVKTKNEKLFRKEIDEFEKKVKDSEIIIKELKSILPNIIDKSLKKEFTTWKNAELKNEISHPSIYNTIRVESENIRESLEKKYFTEKIESTADLEKIQLLKSLIAILDDYREVKFNIPSINLSVSEFIMSIQEELSNYDALNTKLNNIDFCSKKLGQLGTLINGALEHSNYLSNNIKESEMKDISDNHELDEIERELKEVSTIVDKYNADIIKDDLDPKKIHENYTELRKDIRLNSYEIYTETQIENRLSDWAVSIQEQNGICRKIELRIEHTNNEIDRLEKKEPHIFQDKFNVLSKVLTKLQNLEQRFIVFDRNINILMNERAEKSDLDEKGILYLRNVGEFLAKKVETIKHIDNVYNVKNINVIKKTITSKENKEIHFTDLGTGQGQAAYLDTLLSMSENKKIIALFDEVAMMDEVSLGPIKEKLKKLYLEKKLFMAIIVQKAEKVIVEGL
jgi:DNA repair protein SbcC/Rad50